MSQLSCRFRPWHSLAAALVLVASFSVASPVTAQPAVIPTAEGQIGETPAASDQVIGSRFESIRGQAGDVLLGGIFVFGGAMPPPPAMSFATDTIHGTPDPAAVGATTPLSFTAVDKVPPASSRARNAAADGDFVAFSFAHDGAMPQTMTVRVATFDETGSAMIEVPLAENVSTFFFPDPSFAKTAVAVDEQARTTVAYTELESGTTPVVKAQRIDGITGLPIGGTLTVSEPGNNAPDVALLDPSGNRLVIPSIELQTPTEIRGNIVDLSGPSPAVSAEFPISSTAAAFGNINPAVAADPATGAFTVVWEHVTGVVGNPVDIRARRFDADGNPIGNDFVVNSTTANSQGQPAVAHGPEGVSVFVWAGDGVLPQDALDVFAQVYDATGSPIGGELSVNTATTAVQDRPTVRFLPEPDGQGRPQFVVSWRDVGMADGSAPQGTGTSYRCFSIDGLDVPIFEDGFETGDTTSWSDSQQ